MFKKKEVDVNTKIKQKPSKPNIKVLTLAKETELWFYQLNFILTLLLITFYLSFVDYFKLIIHLLQSKQQH